MERFIAAGGGPVRRARPGALRDAGLAHWRGADARLHERGGAAAHPRDGGDPLLQPLAGRDLAQGRDLGQPAARAPDPLRLRRRRARRPGRAGRVRPATRVSARASTATSRGAPTRLRTRHRPTGEPAPATYEALAVLERTLLDRRATPARRLLHGRAARRPAADRRQGARGGRGGGARRRLGVRRSGWPRRRPTSSTTCRCCWSRAGSRSRRRWRC